MTRRKKNAERKNAALASQSSKNAVQPSSRKRTSRELDEDANTDKPSQRNTTKKQRISRAEKGVPTSEAGSVNHSQPSQSQLYNQQDEQALANNTTAWSNGLDTQMIAARHNLPANDNDDLDAVFGSSNSVGNGLPYYVGDIFQHAGSQRVQLDRAHNLISSGYHANARADGIQHSQHAFHTDSEPPESHEPPTPVNDQVVQLFPHASFAPTANFGSSQSSEEGEVVDEQV